MAIHVLEEAKRCLMCKKPRCREGCPVNTPIPQMIELLLKGDIEQAGELLYANNPLSVVCSVICPHEKNCEGHCIRGIKSSPIHISSIENYISDFYLSVAEPKVVNKYEGNIAVIGGGPAGMSLAVFMAQYGYNVTIFESKERIGGIMRYGIPEFRLPSSVIDRLEEQMTKMGIRITPNTLVGPMIKIEEMFRDGYDAVFMGTGVWNPKKMNVLGETLPNVHYAINYLKSPHVYPKVDSMVVIGAGNVAMDVARTARRMGIKNVSLMYRKGRENISATEEEFASTQLDGVNFEWYKQATRFTTKGLYYYETFDGATDEEKFYPVDEIVIAISQETQKNIAISDDKIKLDEKGLVITDAGGQTTREGVFATGDVVTGAKTVVDAVYGAKCIANEMHVYIQKKKNPGVEVEPLYEIRPLAEDRK